MTARRRVWRALRLKGFNRPWEQPSLRAAFSREEQSDVAGRNLGCFTPFGARNDEVTFSDCGEVITLLRNVSLPPTIKGFRL